MKTRFFNHGSFTLYPRKLALVLVFIIITRGCVVWMLWDLCNAHVGSDARSSITLALTPWHGLTPAKADNTAMASLKRACKDIDPCISIHVFLYQRLNSSEHLLHRLASSNYSGYDRPLPLVIHLDRPRPQPPSRGGGHPSKHSVDHPSFELQRAATEFPWPHGPKILDVKPAPVGLKRSWLEAWTAPSDNDIMIAFEDDMDVSLMYFQWLWAVLRAYNLLDARNRDPLLLGLSLSPVRIDEIGYPFRPWRAHDHVSPRDYPLHLHAVPSSWGAVYFGNRWRQFLDFVAIRSAPPFYAVHEEELDLQGYGWHTKRGDPNLWLPDSRSNNWVGSWKRFMVDFAYGRGAYMLYPNLANATGLATSLCLQGEHVPSAAEHKNPRVAPLVADAPTVMAALLPSEGGKWPTYSALPLFDMHGLPITRIQLAQRGDDFLGHVASLRGRYGSLVKAWQRPCVMDAAVSGDNREDNFPVGDRFLAVAPQMGFSNQLTAIMHSALWAHALQRVLVLPYFLWPRASDPMASSTSEWVPFHEVFQVNDTLQSIFPGLRVVHADLSTMRTWRPRRIVLLEPEPMLDQLQDVYFRSAGWGDASLVDLRSYREKMTTLEGVYGHLATCADEHLVLNGLYKNPVTWKLTLKRQVWKQLFATHPMVAYIASQIRDTIRLSLEGRPGHTSTQRHGHSATTSGYACLHVRLSDFTRACSMPPDGIPWLEELYKQKRKCAVTEEDIHRKIAGLPHRHVVVLSDDTNRLFPLLRLLNKTVTTSTDIRATVAAHVPRLRPRPSRALLDVISAVVEQQVCSKADHVTLNAFSTFSRSMEWSREGAQGIEYW